MTKFDILKQCSVEGLNVRLPDIRLERKLYQSVKKILELIEVWDADNFLNRWINRATLSSQKEGEYLSIMS